MAAPNPRGRLRMSFTTIILRIHADQSEVEARDGMESLRRSQSDIVEDGRFGMVPGELRGPNRRQWISCLSAGSQRSRGFGSSGWMAAFHRPISSARCLRNPTIFKVLFHDLSAALRFYGIDWKMSRGVGNQILWKPSRSMGDCTFCRSFVLPLRW